MSDQSPIESHHPPDHRISAARIPESAEPPRVKSVVNLKAYLKPLMDEELSDQSGGTTVPGTEMICGCVPVAQCACDLVQYHVGSNPCPSHCPCEGTCYTCKHWICTCVWV